MVIVVGALVLYTVRGQIASSRGRA
jgi:hypothetical protein